MMGGLKRGFSVLVAVGLVAALVGCASGAKAPETTAGGAEPIKIGAVLSLTGSYAGLGESEKNALELEVKRINDAGGVNGRPIEVLIEDDQTDEAKAVAAASKLIAQDQVIAVIGASGTGQSMAMRSELQRAGVPQVSMAGGTVITGQFDPLVFQTPWSNTIVVPFVLGAIKADGHQKVALISDSGGYGKDGREIILSQAKDAGIEIVADETFNPGDTDMSAQLTRIKGSGADALLMWSAGKEASTVVKGAQELSLGMPMYGGSGQARTEFVEGAGDAAEGFTFGTGKSLIAENWPKDSAEYGAVSDFAARYQEAYNEAPDIFAGHAFDAINIVTDGLQRAGADADSKALRDAIEQTESLAGFGGNFTFSEKDHNGLTTNDLALYRIEGGKWVAAK